MSQITATTIQLILDALDGKYFSRHDFIVDFPKNGNTLCTITFKHKHSYILHIIESISESKTTIKEGMMFAAQRERIETDMQLVYKLQFSPGSLKITEKFETTSINGITNTIREWSNHIYNELAALTPKLDPLEKLRIKFNEEILDGIEDPESRFDTEELIAINAKIDDLYSKLQAASVELNLTKEQLQSMKSEFQSYKSTATVMPKGVWASSTANKILKFLSSLLNTPEGRQFLFSQIQMAIGYTRAT